jgi:hypothetical protein
MLPILSKHYYQADAVCHQLGYPYATDYFSNSHFGYDYNSPSYTHVSCSLNSLFSDCLLRYDESLYSPSQVVGVICYDYSRPTTTPPPIKDTSSGANVIKLFYSRNLQM